MLLITYEKGRLDKTVRKIDKILYLIICCIIMITGCTTPGYWSKPRINESDFKSDVNNCKKYADLRDPHHLSIIDKWAVPLTWTNNFDDCMEMRGYQKEKNDIKKSNDISKK
jgi:hypothetical protein